MDIPLDPANQVRVTGGLRILLEQLDAEFGPVEEEIKQRVDAELDALFGGLRDAGPAGTSGSAVRTSPT